MPQSDLLSPAQYAIRTLPVEEKETSHRIRELRHRLKSTPRPIVPPIANQTTLHPAKRSALLDQVNAWDHTSAPLSSAAKRLSFVRNEIRHWNDRIFWERQPWAHHILLDGKDIKNRDRSLPFNACRSMPGLFKPDVDWSNRRATS